MRDAACPEPPSRLTAGFSRGFWVMLTILAMVSLARIAVLIGADQNFDLRSYHLYSPYAALNDRLELDHNPASIQTYLNPTLDILLTYPLFESGGLLRVTQILGGLQGINFVLIVAISLNLLRALPFRDAWAPAMVAVWAGVLGVTGAFASAELGASFGDLTTASLVLGALLLCLRGVSADDRTEVKWWLATGGLLVGMAVGLKLTNAVFLIGLTGALALSGGAVERIRRALGFAITGAVGVIVTHGWWSMVLWRHFGNPVFPFFNSWFRSPFYSQASSFSDDRFMPVNWLQSLVYPFVFSWNHQTAEWFFRDFRFPVAYALACLLGLAWIVRYRKRPKTLSEPAWLAEQANVRVFIWFIVLSYVIWQLAFSIQRYAVTIELLLPAFMALVLVVLFSKRGLFLFLALAVGISVTTIRPDPGRLAIRHAVGPMMSDQMVGMLSARLEGSAVMLQRPPLAYLATLVRADGVAWFGEIFNEHDRKAATVKLAAHERIFVILEPRQSGFTRINKKLAIFGLPPVRDVGCLEFSTLFDRRLILCEVAKGSVFSM